MRKFFLSATFLGVSALALGGCHWNSTDDSTQHQAQAAAYQNMTRNQAAPAFKWSLPRALLNKLYAFEQHAVITYSVVQSPYTGKILWECKSRGFPIPFSTQLTNPDQIVHDNYPTHGAAIPIPQQEPDGLFHPDSTRGTWVFCVAPDGTLEPTYEEKDVTVFMHPVVEKNGTLVPAANSTPSNTIDLRDQISNQHSVSETRGNQ